MKTILQIYILLTFYPQEPAYIVNMWQSRGKPAGSTPFSYGFELDPVSSFLSGLSYPLHFVFSPELYTIRVLED